VVVDFFVMGLEEVEVGDFGVRHGDQALR
jgi:hypothetical protein